MLLVYSFRVGEWPLLFWDPILTRADLGRFSQAACGKPMILLLDTPRKPLWFPVKTKPR